MTTPVHPSEIRLIATDLDGTLLRPDKTISERTTDAIRSAHEAGLQVVAATGRYPATLAALLTPVGIDYAVASNGAQCYRLSSGDLLFEEVVPTDSVRAIMDYLPQALDGVLFEAVTDHGLVHYAEAGYFDLVHEYERRMFPLRYLEIPKAAMLDHAIVKLAVRHPSATPEELLDTLVESGLTGFHATTSGAPFLEISGPGVTKASGVARLASVLGLESRQVLAVGDARNDVELLEWSGIGVAMGNAVAEALAAADHTTASNDEDGLAAVIERLLAS
ncbi:MAG: HAD family hydrolase [Propionicimonas sp.]|nr:HAD family hydrolase [Propionicimonas sp.]